MIVRGAIRRPDFALQIHQLFDKMYQRLKQQLDYTLQKILARIKQWLLLLKLAHYEAEKAFKEVRVLKDLSVLEQWIKQ